jgi:hypothetical protein
MLYYQVKGKYNGECKVVPLKRVAKIRFKRGVALPLADQVADKQPIKTLKKVNR